MSAPLALVTGGARGIGRAIAVALAASGHAVIAAARTPPPAPLPDGIGFAALDVRDAAAVRNLFRRIAGAHGGLQVLVNNAGLAGANSLAAETDDALWHDIVATNLHGSYFCAKAALPLLPDGRGRIVNIASVLGLKGAPDQTAYSAAKHGVVGFTRALALAVAARGITVNAVCPGWVRTDMAYQRFREIGNDEAAAAAQTPTGRITEPEEVAAVVRFLCSAEAGNITGQTITIDGGALA
jgi:NAD(P)-dependent dehydrogenase (short-subunit alcohol dehydrogenase family)